MLQVEENSFIFCTIKSNGNGILNKYTKYHIINGKLMIKYLFSRADNT